MMKRTLLDLCLLFSLAICPLVAHAAQPIVVTHALQGLATDGTSFTIDVAVHVVNVGDTPVSNLSLSLVTRPPFFAPKTVVTVGSLAPHQGEDFPVQMVTPRSIDAKALSRHLFFWSAKVVDVEGKPTEFPVTSRGGGKR